MTRLTAAPAASPPPTAPSQSPPPPLVTPAGQVTNRPAPVSVPSDVDLSPLANRPLPDWHTLVAACPSRSIQAVLQGLHVRSLEPGRVVLDAPETLAKTAMLRREELSQALSKAAGQPMTVEIHARAAAGAAADAAHPAQGGAGTASAARTDAGSASPPAAGQGPSGPGATAGRGAPQALPASSMSDHPLVRQASELLGARLIRVERRETSNG